MDCDQRGLESSLTKLEVPLFIIHGKHDPLIPSWVAQEHHRLQPRSRLVILDGSHFFPFGFGTRENFAIAYQEMSRFLAAADRGAASRLYGQRNETGRKNLRAVWNGGPSLRGYKPWWLVGLAGMALGFFTPRSGGVLAGLAGALLFIDFLTGLGGVILGGLIKRGDSRTRFHKAAAVVLFGILGTIPGALLLPVL